MAQQAIINFEDLTSAAITSVSNSSIPTGSKMVFYQATAPTGWTKDLVQHDKAMRVVTGGTGGGAGGSTTFSTAWNTTNTGASAPATDSVNPGGTVNTASLGSHTHVLSHGHSTGGSQTGNVPGGSSHYVFFGNGTSDAIPSNVTTSSPDLSHSHSFSPGSHAHTVNSHTHTTSFTPAFIDVIIATKN